MSELWQESAATIARLVRERKSSAVEVAEAALARLDSVNPAINAVVTEMPDEALAAARSIDESVARGDAPGPLCGVPVTVKVNADQKGYATTNGCKLQKDLIAEEDNPVVANLRKAGAVIIGRTNTPAFSLRWFTRNSIHGHTRNPRNPALTPGGSSGGAAAAVTAGIGAIGHGTDIAGSIRYPAYACGIHGLRPTLGRIPAANFTTPDRMIGAQLMAVSGPIARTVSDLRLGLGAMSAEDLRDPWWVPVPLELQSVPKRVALTVAPENLVVEAEVEKALRDAARRLEDAGWEVTETACPPLREAAQRNLGLWLADIRHAGREVIAKEGDPDASFVFAQLEALAGESDLNGIMNTLQARAALTRQWQLFLNNYAVLICPASARQPFPDLLDVESPDAFRRIAEAQLTMIGIPFMGLPGLTVSTGIAGDAPVGVQLVAGRYREDLLLDAGEIIERGGAPPSPVDPVA